MSRDKRLQKTADALQHVVDKDEQALLRSQEQENSNQQSIHTLQQVQQASAEQLLAGSHASISAWKMQGYGQFQQHVQTAILQETASLQQTQTVISHCTEKWQASVSKKMAVDIMYQKKQEALASEQRKRDQTDLYHLIALRTYLLVQ